MAALIVAAGFSEAAAEDVATTEIGAIIAEYSELNGQTIPKIILGTNIGPNYIPYDCVDVLTITGRNTGDFYLSVKSVSPYNGTLNTGDGKYLKYPLEVSSSAAGPWNIMSSTAQTIYQGTITTPDQPISIPIYYRQLIDWTDLPALASTPYENDIQWQSTPSNRVTIDKPDEEVEIDGIQPTVAISQPAAVTLTGVAPSATASGSNTVTVTANCPFSLIAAAPKMTHGSYTLSDPLTMSSTSGGTYTSLVNGYTLASESVHVSSKMYNAYYRQLFGAHDTPGTYTTIVSWNITGTY